MADEMKEIGDDLLQEHSEINGGENLDNEEILAKEEKSTVITQELAKQYGLSNTMIGKTMEDALKSYQGLLKQNTQLSQKFAERDKAYEQKFAELEAKLTAKEVAKVETKADEKVESLIGEAPEPMDFGDPKEYKKALAVYLDKRDEIKQKILMDAIEKKFGEQFGKKTEKLEQAYSEQLKEKNAAIMDELVTNGLAELYDSELPEGITVESVYEDWLESIKNRPQEALSALYGGNPEQMAEDVLLFQQARYLKEFKASLKDPKLAERLHKEQVEKLKNKDTKVTRQVTSPRGKVVEGERNYMKELGDDLQKEREMNREK